MEKRQFAGLGDDVSLLGFGGMRFPLKEGSKEVDVAATEKLIAHAMSREINYYDTAYPYHEGKAEEILGGILKAYPRDQFFLADKLPIWMLHSEEEVDTYFEEQLRRCQVEYFDYYLVHSMDGSRIPLLEKFHVYEKLRERQKKGQIRHLGFSFHDSPEVLRQIVEAYPWDFAQIQLNYLDWELQRAKEQYQVLEAAGLPCIVMEPVRGGSLASLSPEAVAILQQARPGESAASWAIRFAASRPGVLTVLSGMSAMEQLQDNLRVMESFQPITPEEETVLWKALAEYRKAGTIPCTGCRYCMDCPFGVSIPEIFSLYNAYCVSRHPFGLVTSYRLLGEKHQSQHCVQCGQCMEHCPQNLPVPELLRKVDAEVRKVAEEQKLSL